MTSGSEYAHASRQVRAGRLEVEPLSFRNRQAHGRHRLSRMFARAQAYVFFPLLFLDGPGLHVNSVKALCGRPWTKQRPAE
jgi:hypothetical protein